MTPEKILFVCTGNQCRSPMAEGLLKHLLSERCGGAPSPVTVSSCGTGGFCEVPATKEAVQVMAEGGIDISAHRSRPLTEALLREADLVLVMSEGHLRHIEMLYPGSGHKTHLLREYMSKNPALLEGESDIADPIGRSLDAYREVYVLLREECEKLCATLQ
jgi:protein-tyrosine-phosphatase